jgi:threonine dehydrogenase-like Zn-dependent dehydrogenase
MSITMDDNRLRVGIVGCGGITRALYVRVYALVADIARVVAVADLDEGRANHVRTVLGDAYNSEAYRSRVLAADARKPEERDAYHAEGRVGGVGCDPQDSQVPRPRGAI